MAEVNHIADFIIFRLKSDDNVPLSNLKLQKLLYYSHAWRLAIHNESLVDEEFEAWIHGPALRSIYDRFDGTKYIYSEMELTDIKDDSHVHLDPELKKHIDEVLEAYGSFSGTELEYMSHNESPWLETRKGLRPSEKSDRKIDNELIKNCYKARLKN